MQNITVIGAGVSGLNLINKVRSSDKEVNITLIDKNLFSFCKKKIVVRPEDFKDRIDILEWAKERNVEFINDTVERVSAKRRKIYLKNSETRVFDNLVVATGFNSKKLSLKGEHREGFFYFSNIDPLKLRDLLKISNEVTVQASTLLGVDLSFSLQSQGKEVRMVGSDLSFLGEHKDLVTKALENKNIILHPDLTIEEAVGERLVRAVKLSPLKVFSSQLVFIDSGLVPNREFFEEEIQPKDTFFTNFEGVYLLGDVTDSSTDEEHFFTNNYEDAIRQTEIFSEFIIGGKTPVFEKQTFQSNDVLVFLDEYLKEVQSWQSGLA